MSEEPTRQFRMPPGITPSPELRKHSVPREEPRPDEPVRFDRTTIAVVAILAASVTAICGIFGWVLVHVWP